MARSEMKDIIVLLPGICGSVLKRGDKDIWSFSRIGSALVTETLWPWPQGPSLNDQLLFNRNDPDDNDDDSDFDIRDLDGVTATSLVKSAGMVPGLFNFLPTGYEKIRKKIASRFNIVQGNFSTGDAERGVDEGKANYYEFPYDWRRSNAVNARKLKGLLTDRLNARRKYLNDGFNVNDPDPAKVILVAHSMGGLISRYYIECLEGWRDCKALITLGTPFRGSVKSLDYLANGHQIANLKIANLEIANFVDLTNAMRSLPSVYQLLPTFECLDIADESSRSPDTKNYVAISKYQKELTRGTDINADKLARAVNFHEKIQTFADKNQGTDKTDENINVEYLQSSFVTIPIIGVYQATPLLASFSNQHLKITKEKTPSILQKILQGGKEENLPHHLRKNRLKFLGDDTVPYLSAIPRSKKARAREERVPVGHGALPFEDSALEIVCNELEGLYRTDDYAGLEDTESSVDQPSGIGLDVEDVYLANQAISVQANLIKCDAAGVEAEISSALGNGNGTVRKEQFEKGDRDEEWRLSVDGLRAGLYRLSVKTQHNSRYELSLTVNRLFAVIDG